MPKCIGIAAAVYYFAGKNKSSAQHRYRVEKVRLNVLGLAHSPTREDTFTLLLKETQGSRQLPILIGALEAQAIALALEEEQFDRPIPHDLFRTALVCLGYTVEEVIITDLKNQVFFAQIILSNSQTTVAIDARPSDAIAIGLRFGADLCIYEALLDETHIFKQDTPVPKEENKHTELESIQECSTTSLKKMLESLVEREDYEQAALIRDELRRRERNTKG